MAQSQGSHMVRVLRPVSAYSEAIRTVTRGDPTPPREPDFQIAGLQVWVHGRQFPEATDYWDGNWLVVTAQCTSAHASVMAGGPILHLSEVASFLEQLQTLSTSLKGSASLDCMEPNLHVQLEVDRLGHVNLGVKITPDHLSQAHKFRFEIDQTYLLPVIRALRRLFDNYPIRDKDRL